MKLNLPSSHPLREKLKPATRRAEKLADRTLGIEEHVTIAIDNNLKMVDPNIGIGGYTDSKNQITLSLDSSKLETISDDEIFATLIHELSHVKRAYGPWYGTTLFDYLVFEGLGVALEEELCGDRAYYPNHLRESMDAAALIEKSKHMFDYDDTKYNYMDFVIGNEELGIPASAIYGMGLYIVDQHLARTGKEVSELLLEDSAAFRPSST